MKVAALFLAVSLALLASPSRGESLFSPDYAACRKAAADDLARYQCIKKEKARLRTALDIMFGEVLTARRDPLSKTALREAQMAWGLYLERNCAYYASTRRGSAAGVRLGDCQIDMMSRRLRELEALKLDPGAPPPPDAPSTARKECRT